MSEIKIIYKSVDEIQQYEKNPRKNDHAVDYVANSIKEFGFKVPIVIDRSGTIIAGHTRYKAAKQLGLTEVPCIIADDLSPEQVKAFRIADNKTGERAVWDNELLKLEMLDLQSLDFDLTGTGFDELEIDKLLNEEPYEFGANMGDEFQEYDEDIEVNHKCPKCGYEWSE